jgi:hypothetical protein
MGSPATELLLLGAVTGLLASVVPYTLELSALRRLAPRVFGVLLSLEPAIAALAGWALLAQPLGTREAVAVGLVVLASVGSTLTARQPRADEPAPQPSPHRAAVPESVSTTWTADRARGSRRRVGSAQDVGRDVGDDGAEDAGVDLVVDGHPDDVGDLSLARRLHGVRSRRGDEVQVSDAVGVACARAGGCLASGRVHPSTVGTRAAPDDDHRRV